MLWTYDHGNQQKPPFSKLNNELLKQFEGSRTLLFQT